VAAFLFVLRAVAGLSLLYGGKERWRNRFAFRPTLGDGVRCLEVFLLLFLQKKKTLAGLGGSVAQDALEVVVDRPQVRIEYLAGYVASMTLAGLSRSSSRLMKGKRLSISCRQSSAVGFIGTRCEEE